MKITRQAFKAARALLDLEQRDVELATGIPRQRISSFETGKVTIGRKTYDTLRLFFENRGIEFLDNDGVRRRGLDVKIMDGTDGFQAFMNNVYHFARTDGGRIAIINGSTDIFIKWLGKDWYEKHAARMEKVKDNINFRIITGYQTHKIASAFATYKTIPGRQFSPQTIYIFGDNIGFFVFTENSLKIFSVSHKEIADTLFYMFDLMWDKTQ